ncbi:MAG: ABC transporter ATP-binding protein [Schleiferiaceae bacterium]
MLSTRNLSYSYGGQQKLTFPEVEIPNNALLLGPSGSGKSTFLHLLTGIIPLQNGSVCYDDEEYTSKNQRELDRSRGKHISLVFQKPQFFPALTVMENLRVQNMARGSAISKADAQACLNALEIGDQAHKNIKNLSVGQRQRVSIARALLAKPDWIFADEPTSALDDDNATRVIQLLLNHSKENHAKLIVVTHDQRLVKYFDQIIQL